MMVRSTQTVFGSRIHFQYAVSSTQAKDHGLGTRVFARTVYIDCIFKLDQSNVGRAHGAVDPRQNDRVTTVVLRLFL